MNYFSRLKTLPLSIGLIIFAAGGGWLWLRHQQVKLINQAQAKILATPSQGASLKELKEKKQNLKQAITSMDSIADFPGSFHDEAQRQKQQLEAQLDTLDKKIEKKAISSFQEAQKLNSQGKALLESEPKSFSNLKEQNEKLEKAVIILREIPPETSIALKAAKLKSSYEQQQKLAADQLDREYQAKASLQVAKIKVLNVTKLTENLPQPAAVWQQASQEWACIIEQLEATPKNTTLQADIDRNLAIYRQTYQTTRKGLEKEVLGEGNLKLAQRLALEADYSAENAPQDLNVWLEIEKKWLRAIAILGKIYPDTTSITRAQNLQEEYQTKLALVRNTRQQIIKQNYQAKLSEIINRLSAFDNNIYNTTAEEYRLKINEFYPLINELTQEPYIKDLKSYKYLIDAYNNYQDIAASLMEINTLNQQIIQLIEQEEEKASNLVNSSEIQNFTTMQEISHLRIEKIQKLARAQYLLNLAKQSYSSAKENLFNARNSL